MCIFFYKQPNVHPKGPKINISLNYSATTNNHFHKMDKFQSVSIVLLKFGPPCPGPHI